MAHNVFTVFTPDFSPNGSISRTEFFNNACAQYYVQPVKMYIYKLGILIDQKDQTDCYPTRTVIFRADKVLEDGGLFVLSTTSCMI